MLLQDYMLWVVTCFVCICGGMEARILGAGINGLTCALLLQENGWEVIIHAESSPQKMDVSIESIPYASPKAGAWWSGEHSFYSHSTYLKLQKETRFLSSTVINRTATILYTDPLTPAITNSLFQTRKYVSNWRKLSSQELSKWQVKFSYGYQMDVLMLTAPDYISYLLRKFQKNGGTIIHEKIRHISELTRKEGTNIVINCAGLGSRTLGGVNDNTVFPERGQVVIVKNPNITEIFRSRGAIDSTDPGNYGTYILPRSNGEIIVGGTRSKDNYTTTIAQDRENILKRAAILHPGILSAEILRDSVGLRPSRTDGIRLETDYSFEVPVIHNYGHGGTGFENSWGCAYQVLSLVSNLNTKQPQEETSTKLIIAVILSALLIMPFFLFRNKS